MEGGENEDIRWDDSAAAAVLGKRVVIGITFVGDGPPRQEQLHGTVVRAEKGRAIDIELGGTRSGEIFTLPPDTTVFRPAARGEYRLRATGEIVVDPNFTVTYEVHQSSSGDGGDAA